MNPLTQIKNAQKASKLEIAHGFSEEASWHARFKHSAYVFAGGLAFGLTEGDLLAIFAQYGEIVDVNLVKDKETGDCLKRTATNHLAACVDIPGAACRHCSPACCGGRGHVLRCSLHIFHLTQTICHVVCRQVPGIRLRGV